jgi:diadenosine tetraphosphate (Ap4A) HIT family hydrolase
MDQPKCPFCRLESLRIRLLNDFAMVFPDGFSVTPGRTLVVPKRHLARLFDPPDVEFATAWTLVARAHVLLVATVQIARRLYQQTEKANGQVWVVEKVLRHLGPS